MKKLACQIAYAGVPQTLREKKYSQQGAEGNTTIPLFLQSENPSYESIKLTGKVVAKILGGSESILKFPWISPRISPDVLTFDSWLVPLRASAV